MNRKKLLISIIVFTAIFIFAIILLKPTVRYDKLMVNQDVWNSLKSSKTESKNLRLEDLEFNDYNVIIDEKNNTLYYSLVNNSNTKYNPLVKFYTSAEDASIAILEEITDEKVKSNYTFKLMVYNANSYRIYDLKCTEFPILSINVDNTKSGNKNNPMKLYSPYDLTNAPIKMHLFNNLTNTPNKIVVSNGKVNRENDIYKISLTTMTPGKNLRENRISLLGMQPSDKYILTPTSDNTDRNTNRVELFVNNTYQGVYILNSISPDNQEKHK